MAELEFHCGIMPARSGMNFYSTHFVATSSQIQQKLARDLVGAGQDSRLTAIVFANSDKPWVAKEIIPLINYWNYRSKTYVTFFFVGYIGDENADEYTDIIADNEITAKFDAKSFVNLIELFEKRTDWKHEGDTPIILCRGYLNKGDTDKAHLDFQEVIEFKIEEILRNGAILSVESFFETLIQTAEAIPGGQCHWKLSDVLGAKTLGRGIIDEVFKRIPGLAKLRAAAAFRVKNAALAQSQ